MINGNVKVLCIPSVFFTYTGASLDKKTPLMKSTRALDDAATFALEKFTGLSPRVISTVGCEQEYFLVDRELYRKRPDLIMAGRTVMGARPAKGQQMEDHYFGSIKDRVLVFMEDLEERLYRLGVPCKTRHNEVAPHQFEMAPIFESANLAADHNQLIMEVLRKVAQEHGLAALLHEKPFADVNGSGKHVNWSMYADGYGNLLEPGDKAHSNLVFLYFLVAVVNAIHKRGSLLRSPIASAGNDHRLGANEAPPAIMSVFLGSHLSAILDKIESSEEFDDTSVGELDLGLRELPRVPRDNTDRNRTSPFAFTGNKFEFRAVGSGQSISFPVAILNAAVAESLSEMNEKLAELDDQQDPTQVLALLRGFVAHSKPVRFEKNNYSEAWAAEAEQRGLDNHRTTPEALSVWQDEDVQAFINKSGILNREEMEAHLNVNLEHYAKTIFIEVQLILQLSEGHLLPAAYRAQKTIAESIEAAANALGDDHTALTGQRDHLAHLANHIAEVVEGRERLSRALSEVEAIEDEMEKAMACAKQLIPLMETLRGYCDATEEMVDASEWSLPTYHQLLFLM
jgi:glutamine synthetase